jgi:N-acetylglutamate synthase-like GNAT family acetyltransferase
MNLLIKRTKDIDVLQQVIACSFQTVADQFGLTSDNCSTNPAFITQQHIFNAIENDALFFGLFEEEHMAGCVSVKRESDEIYTITRLAVLPAKRHLGYGTMLLDYAVDHIHKHKGRIISIGIMDQNRVLKSYYEAYGFVEVKKIQPTSLPFVVCIMQKHLS